MSTGGLIQDVKWPGVVGVESLSVCISHGISPSTALLVTIPDPSSGPPNEFGDLVFGDGQTYVTLRDCRVSKLTPSISSQGVSWNLEIQDHRWRWRGPQGGTGAISGQYNQVDNRGKLRPWTIRSPTELAILCLQKMGETNYVIDLPQGLNQAAGANLNDYLKAGDNFPSSFTNPPVSWNCTPPAEALARLCDTYARRVIWQPINNRVIIAKIGFGTDLPLGPYEAQSATITNPEAPSSINVAGAPLRWQIRLPLAGVAREWDHSYRPMNEVSYCPVSVGGGKVQVTTITLTYPTGTLLTQGMTCLVSLTPPGQELLVVSFGPFGVGDDPSATLATVVAAINASAVAPYVVASTSGNVLTITGKVIGQDFDAFLSALIGTNVVASYSTIQAIKPGAGKPSWQNCGGLDFVNVMGTSQLTRTQALQLAKESVFKTYRIFNADPATRKSPLTIPMNPPLVRRQQLIIQPTKVDQVVPQARLPGGQTRGTVSIADQGLTPIVAGLLGIVPEFYDGYSRDQSAVVYGSYNYSTVGSVLWKGGERLNSPKDNRVYVTFQVEPDQQLVIFNEPVYYLGRPEDGGWLEEPELTLETAVLIQDPVTSEIVRATWTRQLGGAGPPIWEIHEDCQYSWVMQYDLSHNLTGGIAKDLDDATARAQYYLDAMTITYGFQAGEIRHYVGVFGIDVDGLVQQVTWTFGEEGPSTIASTNCEHSRSEPPYPARRRAENLPPNASAAIANRIESLNVAGKIPDPLSAAGNILRNFARR